MKFLIILCSLLLACSVDAQQSAVAPCGSEQHKQFDFWLGQWNVKTADGDPAGINTISKIQDGCVLRENWASATSAFTGTSFNFYNQLEGQWEQLWLDNQGGVLKLVGQLSGKQMILQSAAVTNDKGQMVVQRISWTHNQDGSVRQLWQVLSDGKVSQTAFDGIYRQAE